jgi:hypothetical protein
MQGRFIMQEMLSRNEDILFDLEQIKLLSMERPSLDKDERTRIKKFPKEKRAEEKKRLLAEKEQQKKEYIRRWILALEERVRYSDLPQNVVNQILSMTTYVKERGMKFPYDVEQKMTSIEVQVHQAETNTQKTEPNKTQEEEATISTAGAVTAVLWDKEKYEKRITHYYDNKILGQLGTGQVKENVSRPPEPKKQGSMYSKEHYRMTAKQEEEIQNAIVTDTQKRYQEQGLPVPAKEIILTDLENMHPVKKRFAQKAIYKKHPELEKQHKEEKQALARREAIKNVAKMRLRVLKREEISIKTQNKTLTMTITKTVQIEVQQEIFQIQEASVAENKPKNLKTRLKQVSQLSQTDDNKKTTFEKEKKGLSKQLKGLRRQHSHHRQTVRISRTNEKQHIR